MNIFLTHKLGFSIAGIIILSAVLVACSGGGSGSAPATGADTPTTTISPLTGKNEGGITYTKEDLVGVDANGDGVDDATASKLSSMYSSQPTVLSAFMQSAKLDRDLLSIPDANLPKTKTEAEVIVYNDSRDIAGCKEFQALGISNYEKETLRYYYVEFNTQAKRQRHYEIQNLSGRNSRSVRSCTEILATTTPSVK